MSYSEWSVISGETPTATKWNVLGGNDADFDERISKLLGDAVMTSADDSSTVTFDISQSRLWHVQIAGNRVLALSNVVTKRPIGIVIQQDGSAGRSVTWPSGISWPGGIVPTLTNVANSADMFILIPKSTWVVTSNEVYWGLYGGFDIRLPS